MHGIGSALTADYARFDREIELQSYSASWKMLTVTYTPGVVKGYTNGVLVGEGVFNEILFPADAAYLNRHSWVTDNSSRMDCTYDNVRIYSRALSASETQQLYEYESGPRVTFVKAFTVDYSGPSKRWRKASALG